eukprot:CAMPEP_0205862048 /NCGR_PEP_ID=MMETSP1083-20121108/6098_1 /ASSEMBLY_ACC=CAM_ASM_000430 /TAXON_ID=97485 /ORGANISM="Prymnesium parvum, Strain Texoma1" /LENGTH=208 /DNA_ID=CAMNT_0053223799 /DNA_START=735 /DNA_END=1361 /DNA_ORIENTATION=-
MTVTTKQAELGTEESASEVYVSEHHQHAISKRVRALHGLFASVLDESSVLMPSYLGHRPVAPISPLLVSTHDIEDGGGSEYVRVLLAQLPFTLPLIYARANTEPNGTGQRNVDDERSRHFVRALVITPKKSTATLKDHMERDREQIPSHNAFSFAMGDVEPNGSRRPTIKIKAYSVRSRGEPKMDHVRPPPREVHQVEAGEQSNLDVR